MALSLDSNFRLAVNEETIESEPRHVIQLSNREQEVLLEIAEGRSSKEAAERLFVSKRTVDFHLANTYVKLGANNRVQAIRIANELGLMFNGTSEPPVGQVVLA